MVQNEPIHNADDGELKIKRRSVIDKDGLFWGKGRSIGGGSGGGGGSHDANNGVDDREKVLLLSEGNPLFFGNGSEIMDYFQSIGFSPSVAINPMDFLLDLANGILSYESSQDDHNAVKQKFVLAYKSNLDENLKAETLDAKIQLKDVFYHKNSDQSSMNWVQQLMILLRRGLKERRHKSL
ncbi:hypothetical protein Tco_0569267 [Tanacetum coccineum]